MVLSRRRHSPKDNGMKTSTRDHTLTKLTPAPDEKVRDRLASPDPGPSGHIGPIAAGSMVTGRDVKKMEKLFLSLA